MPKVTAIQANSRSNRKKLRVAAYCRVSTDSDAQLESLETQMAHYEKYINDHSGWEYVGLYYDEGLSGTKMSNRVQPHDRRVHGWKDRHDYHEVHQPVRPKYHRLPELHTQAEREKHPRGVRKRKHQHDGCFGGSFADDHGFSCTAGEPIPLAERAARTAVPIPERKGERQYQAVPRIHEGTGRKPGH